MTRESGDVWLGQRQIGWAAVASAQSRTNGGRCGHCRFRKRSQRTETGTVVVVGGRGGAATQVGCVRVSVPIGGKSRPYPKKARSPRNPANWLLGESATLDHFTTAPRHDHSFYFLPPVFSSPHPPSFTSTPSSISPADAHAPRLRSVRFPINRFRGRHAPSVRHRHLGYASRLHPRPRLRLPHTCTVALSRQSGGPQPR